VWSNNADAARTIDVILAADPDVVAVQEEPGPFAAARATLMQALPFRVACPAGSDLALYSRTKPVEQSCPVKPSEFDGGIWIRVRDRMGRIDTVVTTHFPWPFPPEPRAEQLSLIDGLLRDLGAQDAVLVGDFNLAPWAFTMQRQDQVLRPLVRQTHGIATWPVRLGRVKASVPFPILAIDQVYVGPGWRDCIIRRLPRAGSDHLGLSAALYH
jgi:endonuclease/exonuclease/phosphatase (EEP) superfamily protein YafD